MATVSILSCSNARDVWLQDEGMVHQADDGQLHVQLHFSGPDLVADRQRGVRLCPSVLSGHILALVKPAA